MVDHNDKAVSDRFDAGERTASAREGAQKQQDEGHLREALTFDVV